jgi:transcriptional regulator with XRE-family HTH domain
MDMESWSAYVRRVAGGLTQVQISEKTGLAQTNIGRWLRGDPGAPKAESVIAFARSFGQPPVEALAAAGYLEADEASSMSRTPLSEYSDRELVGELSSRLSKEAKQT